MGKPLGLLAMLAAGLLAASCDASLDRARTGLRIGYAVEAPYAFLAADGSVTGESPLIAREVARRLHLGPIIWRQVEFARLFEELAEGKIDLVAAGTFITAARSQVAAFSVPTFRVRESLLVRRGNPAGFTRFLPDEDEKRTLAVIEGAVEGPFLEGRGWKPNRLTAVPDALTGLGLLKAGRVDALVLSAPTLRYMAAQQGETAVEVVTPPASPDNAGSAGALAFRREDRALREAFDRELLLFLGSPEHRALVGPLGFSEDELP